MIETGRIWFNGELKEHDDAKVHVLSHVLHYGSGCFEGIRLYKLKNGKSAVFRLKEHIDRLYDSCKIYKMEVPYTKDEFIKGILDTIKTNKLEAGYIRPLIFRGYNQLGVNPTCNPVEAIIAAWKWGAYLGEEGLKNGIKVCVSSWRRPAPNTLPALAKASGNYLSSQLIKMEALDMGFEEGLALDYLGNISEGSGENIFLVKNGELLTPPMASSSLAGITRDVVVKIAKDLGLVVKYETLPREFLYLADEIFLTGTAAEITPVSSVDNIKVGCGSRGEMTKKIQEEFFKIVEGENEKYREWLTIVE
ncbi:branched-chain amino acid transaminase [Cetobacterium somerae]|uniref:Branched-chain-amino-acid aminotransferase n=2 Tax=Cetobacterium TaxID=180162 RepID=U7V444_9FUSO|nr:branched-chain amino acid transaminase [Cetobacterium somerae]ERT66320.1 branched-chain-amino-acid transaminase [Cetobacterium somerae ATCC BAA-474]MCQ9627868.1 branched-chain amino acid transaminase [Cetobacterium somerae]